MLCLNFLHKNNNNNDFQLFLLKDLEESLFDRLNTFMLMNQFLIQKNYPIVVEIFERYLKNLESVQINSKFNPVQK